VKFGSRRIRRGGGRAAAASAAGDRPGGATGNERVATIGENHRGLVLKREPRRAAELPPEFRSLVFRVDGVPQPKGSFVAFVGAQGRVVVKADAKLLKRWCSSIRIAARDAIARQVGRALERDEYLFSGAVQVEAVFFLHRPLDHYGAAGGILPRFGARAAETKPDLDKLMRALGDALSGLCYVDDARIVDQVLRKRYVWADQIPGVAVRVSRDV